MSETNVLETNGLGKTYTAGKIDYEVLKDVNLQIKHGECVAIMGKSGSGKSTLMYLLACLDDATSGHVLFEGADLATLSKSQKNDLRNNQFGFVFQQFFLNGRDTVFENVALPMKIRGVSQNELSTNAMSALKAVGLDDKAHKNAMDLSGGEKQRVCIARALVGDPNVIFADEPTGNLDSKTGETVEDLLFQLNQEKGITLIIVTHDEDLAAKCERIIELRDGRIVEVASAVANEGGAI